jgi:16S rRNA processing protein RimM
MKIADCFQLGAIVKPHGIQGLVSIYLDVDFPDDYAEMDSVFVLDRGQLEPYFIDEIRINGNKGIVQFEEIDTVEKAEMLAGKELYLPLKVLPKLGDNQFYFHEITDFKVIDKQAGELGTVLTVYSFPHQDLIAMLFKGVEVLIPISDDIVLNLDRKTKVLNVNLPEGLIDIYLDEN